MKRKIFYLVLFLILTIHLGLCEEIEMDENRLNQRLGYVVVTPEGPKDGGDFGKYTRGTKTSGIQEALDYAKANNKNLFITGVQNRWGTVPPPVTYTIEETIKIPPMQGFRIDGGQYIIGYAKSIGDAIHIDSCMDCYYKFGLVTSQSKTGAVIKFKPENPVPIDNMVSLCESVFVFSSIVGGGVFDLTSAKITESPQGTGILLDASLGTIDMNKIFATAVLLCNKGVYLKAGSGKVTHNDIQILHNHQCNTHLQIGDAGTPGKMIDCNRIDMTISSEGMIAGSIGADIFGQKNILTLDVKETASGKNIIFEDDAKDNIIFALNLPQGITNNARNPTNRIIPTWPIGFNVPTPTFPASGKDMVNTNPYPVEIIILKPGRVSDWTITDANGNAQEVKAKLSDGQDLVLEPGDKIRFTYTAVPAWRWRALE